jgi:hypothetical protein
MSRRTEALGGELAQRDVALMFLCQAIEEAGVGPEVCARLRRQLVGIAPENRDAAAVELAMDRLFTAVMRGRVRE